MGIEGMARGECRTFGPPTRVTSRSPALQITVALVYSSTGGLGGGSTVNGNNAWLWLLLGAVVSFIFTVLLAVCDFLCLKWSKSLMKIRELEKRQNLLPSGPPTPPPQPIQSTPNNAGGLLKMTNELSNQFSSRNEEEEISTSEPLPVQSGIKKDEIVIVGDNDAKIEAGQNSSGIPVMEHDDELIWKTEKGQRGLEGVSCHIFIQVALLPGSVLTLVMSKSHGFRYRSGQYIFLQCPAVSPFEWHPFSITSAPGDEYLSVHIQTTGDWTQELKRIFTKHYFTSGRAKLNELFSAKHKSLPRLLVDGPYGAPAQDFRNYDVLLLVGLGIGATPFISILRDLLNNIRLVDELLELTTETSRSDDSANSFGFSTPGSSSKKRPHRTASAHFYWVTREPGSFEWFKGVMNEVAEMDRKMHNYLTSVYEEGDARSTLLTMVQALNHAKNGFDIVSGTRVRTHFARPNWREVFTKIASKYQGATVGVFYCGTPGLAKELRSLSHEMSHKTSTRFHFHKEYF